MPAPLRNALLTAILLVMVVIPMPPRAFGSLLRASAGKAKDVLAARKMSKTTAHFRGGNLAIQSNTDDEVALIGPAGTGKTYAVLVKINRLMWRYPGLRVLVLRKVRADLAQSTLVTWERHVLGPDNPICAGATTEHRVAYYFPNGSVMALGGMDRPGKVLSSEWDIIYAAEGVQFTENDWEMMGMRLARDGDFPFPQLITDSNPDRPDHWLKRRIESGQTTGLTTLHIHNPAYYEDDGTITAKGERYMRRLDRLTGIRRLRYLIGEWRSAEGVVYDEWSDAIHLKAWFPIPPSWKRYRVIDFGFNNPFVCQWWAEDPDGRLYLYREIYKTETLVEDHADEIHRLTAGVDRDTWREMTPEQRRAALAGGERIVATIADHDAEDRATLRKYGIDTIAADKRVSVGIEEVKSRLRVQGDGKPMLYILEGARVDADHRLLDPDEGDKRPSCTHAEIGGYVWADGAKKETPVKEDDHGMDGMRYMCMYRQRNGRKAWRGRSA